MAVYGEHKIQMDRLGPTERLKAKFRTKPLVENPCIDNHNDEKPRFHAESTVSETWIRSKSRACAIRSLGESRSRSRAFHHTTNGGANCQPEDIDSLRRHEPWPLSVADQCFSESATVQVEAVDHSVQRPSTHTREPAARED
jgi:hypothetical protein